MTPRTEVDAIPATATLRGASSGAHGGPTAACCVYERLARRRARRAPRARPLPGAGPTPTASPCGRCSGPCWSSRRPSPRPTTCWTRCAPPPQFAVVVDEFGGTAGHRHPREPASKRWSGGSRTSRPSASRRPASHAGGARRLTDPGWPDPASTNRGDRRGQAARGGPRAGGHLGGLVMASLDRIRRWATRSWSAATAARGAARMAAGERPSDCCRSRPPGALVGSVPGLARPTTPLDRESPSATQHAQVPEHRAAAGAPPGRRAGGQMAARSSSM